MERQASCGAGLAEHSALPAKVAELMGALAETLQLHLRALDAMDRNGRLEHAAYKSLATAYREAAARLQTAARQMAGYRDLPPAPHDTAAMAAPEPRAAFERFVRREEELLALLQRGVDRDRAMLASM